MFCIGLHPEVQEKLHQEMDMVFGDDRTRPVTADDLRQMTYLECVIKESLRLYPAGPFFARHLAEDVTAGGYLLPKGTVAWLCIMSLHVNEEVMHHALREPPTRAVHAAHPARHNRARKQPFDVLR